MSKISIVDLEVFYHVGVPDEERARPQRLLLTVVMDSDFSAAAASDSISRYHLLTYCRDATSAQSLARAGVEILSKNSPPTSLMLPCVSSKRTPLPWK